MGLNPEKTLVFFALMLVMCDAALPPERHWNSMLPNTPMPKAVKDFLNPDPDFMDGKSTGVVVGKGGVNVNAGKGKPGGGTDVNVGGGDGVGVHTGKPGKRTDVGVGKGGVSVHTKHKGKPVYVGVKPGPDPFVYLYAAKANQLQDDPNVALFFLERDMNPGRTMNLHFTQTANKGAFLPRKVAESIPFSSKKLPEILKMFSVRYGSVEAELVKNTIRECEAPRIKGEEKFCATSLDSMIDFSISKLGKNIQAVSTEIEKQNARMMQKYRFVDGIKKMGGEKSVICHKQTYPYAVFYCHKTDSTNAFRVHLQGADGSKVNAVAICHKDTMNWNPKHLAFQVLNVKPGTVPICHFLPEDHIVWTTK